MFLNVALQLRWKELPRFCHPVIATCIMRSYGSVAEWLKAAVLKTADGVTRS